MSTQTLPPVETESIVAAEAEKPRVLFPETKRPGFQCRQPEKTLWARRSRHCSVACPKPPVAVSGMHYAGGRPHLRRGRQGLDR